nr:unnamed protein product [Digitaria exilis]
MAPLTVSSYAPQIMYSALIQFNVDNHNDRKNLGYVTFGSLTFANEVDRSAWAGSATTALLNSNNQFLFRWPEFMADQVTPDVTLKVEQETFQDHRVMLAASSPVFDRQLNDQYQCLKLLDACVEFLKYSTMTDMAASQWFKVLQDNHPDVIAEICKAVDDVKD